MLLKINIWSLKVPINITYINNYEKTQPLISFIVCQSTNTHTLDHNSMWFIPLIKCLIPNLVSYESNYVDSQMNS